MKKIVLILMILSIFIPLSLTAEGQQDADSTTIIFGDVSWDSVQVHNRIMGFIIENGLTGYKADYIAGDTMPIINGVIQGDC